MLMQLYNIEQQKELLKFQQYDRFYNNEFNSQEKNALDVDARFYIAANITKSIIDVTPDFILGEAPKVTTENEEAQNVLDYITDTTDMGTVFYDASLTASLKGKSYIKLYLLEGQVMAQALEPDNVIPTYDIYNKITSADVLTAIETREDGSTLVLKETLTAERITRMLIVLDQNKDFREQLELSAHPLTKEIAAAEDNVFGILPLVELKNNTKAQSDIAGCETLVLAINKRLSEIDYIITKHADPKLQVPSGMLERNYSFDLVSNGNTTYIYQNGGIDNKDFKVVGVNPNDPDMKYIQPNMDLTAAYEEIDRLINYLLNQTKTSTSLIQSIKDGTGVESGKALRLKLINTERKLRQKKVFISKAIKEFYAIAQTLLSQPAAPIDIEYTDILNDKDAVVDQAVKLHQAGIISTREALRAAYPTASEDMIETMYLERLEETVITE